MITKPHFTELVTVPDETRLADPGADLPADVLADPRRAEAALAPLPSAPLTAPSTGSSDELSRPSSPLKIHIHTIAAATSGMSDGRNTTARQNARHRMFVLSRQAIAIATTVDSGTTTSV